MIDVYLCFGFMSEELVNRFLKAQKHHPAEEVPEFKRSGIWHGCGGSNVDSCLVCTQFTIQLLEMNLFLS